MSYMNSQAGQAQQPEVDLDNIIDRLLEGQSSGASESREGTGWQIQR